MFKIKLNSDYSISVTDQGRGMWAIQYQGWVVVLEGFGGENSCTIQLTGWQNGHTVIAVTFATVDSNTQAIVTRTERNDDIEAKINEIVDSFHTEASRTLDAAIRGGD